MQITSYFTDFTEYSKLEETHKHHRVQLEGEWPVQGYSNTETIEV